MKDIINKIKIAYNEKRLCITILHKIRMATNSILRKIVEPKIEVDDKTIMFLTFQGNYCCNPKAIANYMIENHKDYKLIWACKKVDLKNKSQYPKELEMVIKGTMKFYKAACRTKVFIDNASNFDYLKLHKKKDQMIIQTWHGSLGFKKLDPKSISNDNWIGKTIHEAKIASYVVSNSDFEDMVYRTSYWKETPILKYGHPRNDILFDKKKSLEFINKIREMYNIDSNSKLFLYAPTFRDNVDLDTYIWDFEKIIDALEERFGGSWVVLSRMHYKLIKAVDKSRIKGKVIDVTMYPDMQELLCAVDIGMTDYSSWLCDFVLTKKPAFLFTQDLDKYVNERGFYYKLNTTPFPNCNNEEELIKNIKMFDEKKYKKNVEDFLKEKGCMEDGKASQRIVQLIDKEIYK